MTYLFIVLIVITCAALAFFVLIQNPKGGGLSGSLGGFGNQMMGAKQSTDVVEKGTWIAASALLALTLLSFIMAPKVTNDANQKTRSEEITRCASTYDASGSCTWSSTSTRWSTCSWTNCSCCWRSAPQTQPAPTPADATPATK